MGFRTDIKLATYNRLHTSNYTKVHYGLVSDNMVMQVNSLPKTYTQDMRKQYNMDMFDLLKVAAVEHYVHSDRGDLQGLQQHLIALSRDLTRRYPDRPPKNYKDAVSSKDIPVIRVNSGRAQGLGLRAEVRVVDGSGQTEKILLRSVYLNCCGNPSRPL
jgi:hypothetical protein